jgi:hypothetical protein
MSRSFLHILPTSSAIVSIAKFRLMAGMQTDSYMGTYWRWLNARPHTHQMRGSNYTATPRTLSLVEELILLQRSWWSAERIVMTSRFRRAADSFGLQTFRPFVLEIM